VCHEPAAPFGGRIVDGSPLFNVEALTEYQVSTAVRTMVTMIGRIVSTSQSPGQSETAQR
jgi:hypothetical protein